MAKMKKNVTPAAEFSRTARGGQRESRDISFDAPGLILTKGGIASHGSSMKTALLASLIGALALAAPPAAARGLTVAVVAPKEGPLAILGQQIRDGARFAAQADGDTVVEVAEACDESDGAGIAKAVLAADAAAAIGFLCTEGLSASLPALAEAKVPAITLSVRSGILMEDALKKKWPLFRLAPGPKAEAEKAVETITRDWKSEPFALIDDGTIHVTRVFIGGDRTDAAVIARDAKAEKAPFRLLGGEALVGADPAVPMTDGVEAIALPDYALTPEGRPVADAMKEKGIVAEGYVLPAHAAMTALAAAAATEGGDLADRLAAGSFTTAIGPLSFGADHELRDNPYRLLVWRAGAFVPAEDRAE